ncbi:hypothetical protein DIZ27_43745 [Streptomyces sp. NWU339]|uniref:hypothetical protein n=1 Tax=Streptomyces sp. NWU339 TaxID=2185284 RepID=UPI000D673901|nr:hypothetical protein [Streptomyces sp. NWU339]PWI04700.1 hypothetical protein DIZ27_43745 [Streptomyces sp. NWU339]
MPNSNKAPSPDARHSDPPSPDEPASLTRGWKWAVAGANLPLLLAPAVCVGIGIQNAFQARVNVLLSEREAAQVHVPGIAGQVSAVTVELDSTQWERLLLALPGVFIGVALALLVWAIWGVRAQMYAPEHRFTDKDNTRLKIASIATLPLWMAAFGAELALPNLLSTGSADVTVTWDVPATFLMIPVALILYVFVDVYRKGKAAYDRQVDVV